MPNLKSGYKRMKTSAQNRDRNRAAKSMVGTVQARFAKAVAGGDKSEIMKVFREYCSILDKTAKRGIIKANNASRNKARASARIAKLAATAKPAEETPKETPKATPKA